MSSTATTAQRSVLRVEDYSARAAAKTITGITQAAPPVITSTAHGYADGDVIYVDGIVGMTELNGRAYVVNQLTADTYSLNGVDATGYTAYSSGGSSYKCTQLTLGNVKDFDIQPDAPSEIDVTNLASTRKEFRIGLGGSWTMTAGMDIDPADTGQAELVLQQDDGHARVYTLTLQSGQVFAGVGYCKSFSASGSPDAVVSGQLSVRGTGQPTWFA